MFFKKVTATALMVAFFSMTVLPPSVSQAQSASGFLAGGEAATVFTPALARGIQIYPNQSLKFDLIVERGDFDTNALSSLDPRALQQMSDNERKEFLDKRFKEESRELIKYFLTALTMPENEMWVNLSPFEKDRIVAKSLGNTDMGLDLLDQDYLLKQYSAEMINPQEKLGKEFWDRIYEKTYEKYGKVDIPSDAFCKIWIVPESATIWEHGRGAFISNCKLKVMLEDDYLALEASGIKHPEAQDTKEHEPSLSTKIYKEIILPEIEHEVNFGKKFAKVRQIYNATILASWYKQALKNSLVNKIYSDQKKTGGIESSKDKTSEEIYNQYVASVKKGAMNFIREEYDPVSRQIIPKKYFSGGYTSEGTDPIVSIGTKRIEQNKFDGAMASLKEPEVVTFDLKPSSGTIKLAKGDLGIDQAVSQSTFSPDEIGAALKEGVGVAPIIPTSVKEFRPPLSTADAAMASHQIDSIKKEGVKNRKTVLLIARSWYPRAPQVAKYYYFQEGKGTVAELVDIQDKKLQDLSTDQGNTIKQSLIADKQMGMQVEIVQAQVTTSQNVYRVQRKAVSVFDLTKGGNVLEEKVAFKRLESKKGKKKKKAQKAAAQTEEVGIVVKDRFDDLVPPDFFLSAAPQRLVQSDSPDAEKENLVPTFLGEPIQHDKTELLTVVLHDRRDDSHSTIFYNEKEDLTAVRHVDVSSQSVKGEYRQKGNALYEIIYNRGQQIRDGEVNVYLGNVRVHTKNYSILIQNNAVGNNTVFKATPVDPTKFPEITGHMFEKIGNFIALNDLINRKMGKMEDIEYIWYLIEDPESKITDEEVESELANIELFDFAADKQLIEFLNRPAVVEKFINLLSSDLRDLNELKKSALAMEVLQILMEKKVFDAGDFRTYKRGKKSQDKLVDLLGKLESKASKLPDEAVDDFLDLILDFTSTAYEMNYITERHLKAVDASSFPLREKFSSSLKEIRRIRDNSMTAESRLNVNKREVGGIDLDPAMIRMNINRAADGLLTYKSISAPLTNIHIDGFVPVITSITPLVVSGQ